MMGFSSRRSACLYSVTMAIASKLCQRQGQGGQEPETGEGGARGRGGAGERSGIDVDTDEIGCSKLDWRKRM